MENTQTEAVSVPIPVVQPEGHWSIRKLWSGRIGTTRYFFGGFGLALFYWLVETLIVGDNPQAVISHNQLISLLIIFIPVFFFIECLIIRRCHDLGYSGWLSLLLLLPVVGFLLPFGLLFKSGEAEPNKYGPPPTQGKKFFAEVFNY